MNKQITNSSILFICLAGFAFSLWLKELESMLLFLLFILISLVMVIVEYEIKESNKD